MMPGTILNIILQIHHFVRIVHVLIDIDRMTRLLLIEFSHLSLDVLQVK